SFTIRLPYIAVDAKLQSVSDGFVLAAANAAPKQCIAEECGGDPTDPGPIDPEPDPNDPGDENPGDENPGDGNPGDGNPGDGNPKSEEHTSELQSRENLVCRLLLEKKNNSRDSRDSQTTSQYQAES